MIGDLSGAAGGDKPGSVTTAFDETGCNSLGAAEGGASGSDTNIGEKFDEKAIDSLGEAREDASGSGTNVEEVLDKTTGDLLGLA
jgi:hypothetical protein